MSTCLFCETIHVTPIWTIESTTQAQRLKIAQHSKCLEGVLLFHSTNLSTGVSYLFTRATLLSMVSPAFSFFLHELYYSALIHRICKFSSPSCFSAQLLHPRQDRGTEDVVRKNEIQETEKKECVWDAFFEIGSTLHKHRLFRCICINCFFFLCQSTQVCFVSILSWVLRDVDNYSCCFSSALAYIDIFGRKFWFLEAVWWKFHEIGWKLLCLERDVLSEKRKKKDKFGDGTAWKGRRFFWGKWSM